MPDGFEQRVFKLREKREKDAQVKTAARYEQSLAKMTSLAKQIGASNKADDITFAANDNMLAAQERNRRRNLREARNL